MLLAVVQQALTSPVPSPEVIEKTLTYTVPAQTPAVVVQAAQFVAMFAVALFLSVVHQVLEYVASKQKGWSSLFNRLLATGYSFGVGIVGTATMHQLGTDVSQLVALGLSTAVALAGSFWTYEVRQALAKLTGFVKLPVSTTTTDSSLPTVTNP